MKGNHEIVYVAESFLEWYRSEYDNLLPFYKQCQFDQIDVIFQEHQAYKSTGISFNYQRLLTKENSNLEKNEIFRENIKRIHQSLNMLTPVQAKDERLWFAMYHRYYQEHMTSYIQERKNNKNFYKNLKSSIFFENGPTRSLIVQNISTLWWLGHYLIDPNNANPYYYVDLFTSSSDLSGRTILIFSSNFTNNKKLLFGLLEAEEKLVIDGGYRRTRRLTNNCIKFLNFTASIQILDMLSKEEIRNLILEEFLKNKEKYEDIRN